MVTTARAIGPRVTTDPRLSDEHNALLRRLRGIRRMLAQRPTLTERMELLSDYQRTYETLRTRYGKVA